MDDKYLLEHWLFAFHPQLSSAPKGRIASKKVENVVTRCVNLLMLLGNPLTPEDILFQK